MTQRARRIWVAVFVVVALIALLAVAGIGEGPNRPLEGKADTATWLDAISAASTLPALIAVGGVLATIFFTNRRERDRQDQERLLARDRQQHERKMQLNTERRQAYATFAQRTSEVYDIDNLQSVPELREAHAMVEILSESPELLKTADDLVSTWRGAWYSARRARDEEGAPDPFDTHHFKNQAHLATRLRAAFIARAKEELGVEEGKALEPTGSGERGEQGG
jgi:hypothetical protein